MKQQQRNRHLRLDVERLGTVLERRTRERDVAYAELETILERRPNKLKTVQTLTKEHDKLAKRLTKDARSNAASFTETASTPQATDFWELRVAEEEYQLEVARLKPWRIGSRAWTLRWPRSRMRMRGIGWASSGPLFCRRCGG